MTDRTGFMDELERDLGLAVRLAIIANAGGQRRSIPQPRNASSSKLVLEFGLEATCWLAGRFGGETLAFPSKNSTARDEAASNLIAAVLDAGLTDPSRSANDIAAEFGVTERWVRGVRRELREQSTQSPDESLPLFAPKRSHGTGSP